MERAFHLYHYGSGDIHLKGVMHWPEYTPGEMESFSVPDYYGKYVLVCQFCGQLWCRSWGENISERRAPGYTCSIKALVRDWTVRIRPCAECMDTYIADRKSLGYGSVPGFYCPGTILSFAERLHYEGGTHDLWELLMLGLPEDLFLRERALWAKFDLAINPHLPLHASTTDDVGSE